MDCREGRVDDTGCGDVHGAVLSRGSRLLVTSMRKQGRSVVARVVGDLDICTVPRLRSALVAALDESPAAVVVVDLREVGFLAVAGMRVLAEVQTRAALRGKSLRVVLDRSHPVVTPMIEAGHLPGVAILDDLDEAVLVDTPCAQS